MPKKRSKTKCKDDPVAGLLLKCNDLALAKEGEHKTWEQLSVPVTCSLGKGRAAQVAFAGVSRIVSGIRFVSDDGKKAEEWYGKTSRLLDKTLIAKLKAVNMEESQ